MLYEISLTSDCTLCNVGFEHFPEIKQGIKFMSKVTKHSPV